MSHEHGGVASLLGGSCAFAHAQLTPDAGWSDVFHFARSVGSGLCVSLLTLAVTGLWNLIVNRRKKS